jgi:hypothetical protein
MKRKELLENMPKNKSDSTAASAIVKLGYPTVAPVMRDMLLWLRVYNSQVADIFAKFFAEITPQPVELIAKHIGTRSETLRNRILVDVLQSWPHEAIQPLSISLTTLATHPDISNNDLECFKLILKHKLAEKKWIRQWLDFRKGQATERVNLFKKLEKQIK